MTPQVVGADVHTDTVSCLLDDEPGRSVANWKDTVIGLQSFFPDIPLEPVPNTRANGRLRSTTIRVKAMVQGTAGAFADHRAGVARIDCPFDKMARICNTCYVSGQDVTPDSQNSKGYKHDEEYYSPCRFSPPSPGHA
jgi:hypothetical protein